MNNQKERYKVGDVVKVEDKINKWSQHYLIVKDYMREGMKRSTMVPYDVYDVIVLEKEAPMMFHGKLGDGAYWCYMKENRNLLYTVVG